MIVKRPSSSYQVYKESISKRIITSTLVFVGLTGVFWILWLRKEQAIDFHVVALVAIILLFTALFAVPERFEILGKLISRTKLGRGNDA